MGNYNTQYQSYYNNLGKKQKGSNNSFNESKKHGRISNFYIKRLTRELVGVLVLFIIVLMLKTVVTQKTQYAYNYSKQILNEQYNYSGLIGKVKTVKFKDVGVISGNLLEKVKKTISGINGINNKENNFK